MEKIAFVFSGGGAKGAFQVGVLKRFEQKGIRPDAVYGTSVGAINAAGYAYKGAKELEKIWRNMKSKSDLFSFNWSVYLGIADGLYNSKPLKKLLDEIVQGEPDFPVDVCKVDLESGKIIYTKHSDKDFKESIRASAAIPLAFEPVGGCVDGGVREKTPLNRAIQDGCTTIYAICCNPVIYDPAAWKIPKSKLFRSFHIGMRSFELLEHEVMIEDLKCCLSRNKYKTGKRFYKKIDLKIFAPDELIIDTLEFSHGKIVKAISQGCNSADIRTWLE